MTTKGQTSSDRAVFDINQILTSMGSDYRLRTLIVDGPNYSGSVVHIGEKTQLELKEQFAHISVMIFQHCPYKPDPEVNDSVKVEFKFEKVATHGIIH